MNQPRWLTVAQVAEELQVSEETVRRWIRAGDLPVLHLGSRNMGYRVRREVLDQFIEERHGPLKRAA